MGDFDPLALARHHRECEHAGERMASVLREILKRGHFGQGLWPSDVDIRAALEEWNAHQWPGLLDQGEPDPGLLTEEEREAIRVSAQLAGLLRRICGDEVDDWPELVTALHVIQRYLGSQAAARAYPGHFRLLGRDLDRPTDDVEPGERFVGAQHFGGEFEPPEPAGCSVPDPEW